MSRLTPAKARNSKHVNRHAVQSEAVCLGQPLPKPWIHQFHSTIPRWRVRIPLAGGLSLALKRSRQQVRAGSMRTTSLSGSDACLASADLMASSNGQRARLHSLDTSAVAMSRPTAERIKDDLNPHYRLLRKCCQRNVQPQVRSLVILLALAPTFLPVTHQVTRWRFAVSAGVNTPSLTFLTARCMARPTNASSLHILSALPCTAVSYYS
ncbi:hypothetical protein BKA62DRAFT_101923 [Auriculariales sp. MPI-PUGE-AT-0066]|nr:hypothetical protein BKA62DRAFT_101923 [Auriculariales sp. MPI-PUGE-AT-0066]